MTATSFLVSFHFYRSPYVSRSLLSSGQYACLFFLLYSCSLFYCSSVVMISIINVPIPLHLFTSLHASIYMHAHTFFPQEIYHTSSKSKTSSYERLVQFVPRRLATVTSMLFGAYPLDMSQYHRLFLSTRCVNVDACK